MQKTPHGPYDAPWMVALRTEPGAALCCDDDCDLSGGRAHVGLCEPCTCGLAHALEECPENRPDTCGACKGQGYHVCTGCKGVGRVPAAKAEVVIGIVPGVISVTSENAVEVLGEVLGTAVARELQPGGALHAPPPHVHVVAVTVDLVLPVVRSLYRRHSAGCCWHIVVDDGNLDDDDVRWVVKEWMPKTECKARECLQLAELMPKLTLAQRQELYDRLGASE